MCTFWASLQGLWFCNRTMILVCNADWLSALFFADDLTCKSESFYLTQFFQKKQKNPMITRVMFFITRVMLTRARSSGIPHGIPGPRRPRAGPRPGPGDDVGYQPESTGTGRGKSKLPSQARAQLGDSLPL